MKYYLVEVSYAAGHEQLAAVRNEHRAYVKTGFDKGMLLLAGAWSTKTGGMVVGKANSRDEIEEFCANDPFRKQRLADYRIIEFQPIMWQPTLGGEFGR